jgi:hypothetical protein
VQRRIADHCIASIERDCFEMLGRPSTTPPRYTEVTTHGSPCSHKPTVLSSRLPIAYLPIEPIFVNEFPEYDLQAYAHPTAQHQLDRPSTSMNPSAGLPVGRSTISLGYPLIMSGPIGDPTQSRLAGYLPVGVRERRYGAGSRRHHGGFFLRTDCGTFS